MGKKGVMLDNGKAAQSSMTLYWKNNKNKQKHPRQKGESHLNQEQQTDKRVMSNFEKWKLHKEKAITKAYTKPTKNQEKNNKKQQLQEEAQDEEFFKRHQMGEKKIINLPGFKSKQELSKRLQPEQVKIADQSTNILKLPPNMSGMTQAQIIQMLRSRKSRQHMQSKQKGDNKSKSNNQDQSNINTNINKQQDVDILLGQEFINLLKKSKQAQNKKLSLQEQQILQKAKLKKEQPFFKSDVLNKIDKQGLKQFKELQNLAQKNKSDKEQNVVIIQNDKQSKNLKEESNVNVQKEGSMPASITSSATQGFKSKFIPRILQK